jgi:hypothetical protein
LIRPTQLFNVADDPGEEHDLAETKSVEAERLERLLQQWDRRVQPMR